MQADDRLIDVPRPKKDASANYAQPSREGKVSLAVWVTKEQRDALKIVAIEQETTVQELLETCVANALAKRRR